MGLGINGSVVDDVWQREGYEISLGRHVVNDRGL